jgi:hypothetical protein
MMKMMVPTEVEDPPIPPMLMVEQEEENRQELAAELVVPALGWEPQEEQRPRRRQVERQRRLH